MNQRLVKRHKRQVARARAKVKTSEPDLRTPEEQKAARDASHTAGSADTPSYTGTRQPAYTIARTSGDK